MAYNENLKDLYNKGMLPLFNAGYINMDRQYLTIGVNGLVEAAEALGIEINDNPSIDHEVEDAVLGDELYYRILNHFVHCLNRLHAQ